MTQNHLTSGHLKNTSVTEARARWLEANQHASSLASEMLQDGSGYGHPDALAQDVHRLEAARAEAERLFREYHDLDRQHIEHEILGVQRSQTLATWASFAVAAVVGIATVVQILVVLLR
jgi:hypothetical protein